MSANLESYVEATEETRAELEDELEKIKGKIEEATGPAEENAPDDPLFRANIELKTSFILQSSTSALRRTVRSTLEMKLIEHEEQRQLEEAELRHKEEMAEVEEASARKKAKAEIIERLSKASEASTESTTVTEEMRRLKEEIEKEIKETFGEPGGSVAPPVTGGP